MRSHIVDMNLEVINLPVSDVGRAKQFYKALGFREDADVVASETFRVVQLTPRGSACSIGFGVGVKTAAPGSVQGLLLAVADIDAAWAELVERGASVTEIFHGARARFQPRDASLRMPGPAPEAAVPASRPAPNGLRRLRARTRVPLRLMARSVDRTWQYPNRLCAAQGPIIMISPVRQRAVERDAR
jgi:catechol 2,3-dioxygenase-like lactoylglutathione lyase family enzyme